jgi:demethylmenaquinone methyltransferase/2-methoxy-6-polyprenyl-1,4-benzoquinol methylase
MTAHAHAQQALLHPDSKQAYNRTLFRDVAPRYNLITRLLSFGRDASWKRWMVAQLPDEVERAVDLACGTGDLTRALAQRYPQARVTGLDLTPEMLGIARQESPDTLAFVEADMRVTGEPDHSVDLVTGGYALRNAPDLAEALQEVSRILRPGGTAAFLDFSAPRSLLLRRLHYVLLLSWGALWGLVVHGNPRIYAYIARSLARFPDRSSFHQQLQTHQLPVVQSRRFMFGMIEVVCSTHSPNPVDNPAID